MNMPSPARVIQMADLQSALTQNPGRTGKSQNLYAHLNTHLGLMGTETAARIQRCHTTDQLLAAAAFGHMAMRESKTGKEFASIFIGQLKFELRSGN